MQVKQQVPYMLQEKKKNIYISLYHSISKQQPMTAYLNGNASDTIFSLGKIKMKLH